jgi:hypothetical protein
VDLDASLSRTVAEGCTSAVDALLVLYEALSEAEQDAAYARVLERRLQRREAADTELARYVRSLRRVAEAIGETPGVQDYQRVSRELIAQGEDLETFKRLYKFFDCSWPRAREALELSEETTVRGIEARFRNRKLGKIAKYTEDVLRETLVRAVEYYQRPPSVEEFTWWRERQIELARAQGEEYPHIPTDSPYRRCWRTWESALLHFGYTPEEVALRLEQRDQIFNERADPYLPDDLPVAELHHELLAGGQGSADSRLSADEAGRVRETYRAFPRRTRYILTVRLGLGVPKQTLRDAAEPLALHLSRIQQLQLYALDALVHAAANGRKTTRLGLRAAVIEGLRQMSSIDNAAPELRLAEPSGSEKPRAPRATAPMSSDAVQGFQMPSAVCGLTPPG